MIESGLQHITAACGLDRITRVLLDQEHARAGRVDRVLWCGKCPAPIMGARPSDGSSMQDETGLRHHRAAERKHLLLAAGERAGILAGCRSREPRKHVKHLLHQAAAPSLRALRWRKAPSSRFSRTVRKAKTRRPSGTSETPRAVRSCDGKRVMSSPTKMDRAGGEGKSAPAMARSVLRLAGAVGADQCDDLALRHMEAEIATGRNVAIGDLQSVRFQ